jgi:HlyD family secretion protein
MTDQRTVRTELRWPSIGAMALIVLLFGGGLVWASLTEIASAVVATGTVGVSGKPKTIQHLDGGIIERIDVEPGQFVHKGEELVLVDDKTVRANLSIYRGRLRDLIVRRQRLLAELDDRDDFEAPVNPMIERFDLGDLAEAEAQQRSMLRARRNSRLGEMEQLDERIAQFRKQIDGVAGLKASKRKQIEVNATERRSVDELVKRNLAARNQLLVYDRAAADLGGQIAEHEADIGRLGNSISEVEIAKLQVGRTFREKTVAELEEVATKIDELVQQVEATEQQLDRTVIKAPVDGIVHELSIFTIGGVIHPGQAIMQIVPQAKELEIEVDIDTRRIDEVEVGQSAVIRFPSFHLRTTPEIAGAVQRISPASIVDEKTGYAFYRVVISTSATELSKLGKKPLLPGMPVEAVIPTAPRTVLQYLVKPLEDSLVHTFREE